MSKEKMKLLTEQNTLSVMTEPPAELETYLRENGYSSECAEVFKNYWPQVITVAAGSAAVAYLSKEALYLKWDKLTFGGLPMKLAGKLLPILPKNKVSQIKKIFNTDKIKKLPSASKTKIFFALAVTGFLGYSLQDTYQKVVDTETKDALGDTIKDVLGVPFGVIMAGYDRLGTSITNSSVGKGLGLQGNECAPMIYQLIGAAAGAASLWKARPVRPIKFVGDVVWNLFTKSASKANNEIRDYVSESITKHLSNRGAKLPSEIKKFFENLPLNTSRYSEETKKQTIDAYRVFDPEGNHLDEAEDIIELIWKDGIYQQDKVTKALGEDASKRLNRSGDDVIETATKVEQMGFKFDDGPIKLPAPKPDAVPDIIKQSDQAFKSGNIKQGIKSLDQVANFYRDQGLLDDAMAGQKALAIIEETRDEFPDATDFEVMRILISRSAEVFSEIGVNVIQTPALVAKIGKGQLDVSDEVIESIIEKEVDDIIFYSTSNLPDVVSDQIPDMREQTVDATMGLFQTMKGKVSKKAATKIAIGAAAVLLTTGEIFSRNKNKPTGSPYYYEDDSVYSILNGITGQSKYKEFRDSVLGNQEALSQFNQLAFNTEDPYIERYLKELAAEEVETQDIEEKVDEVLRGYGDVVLEVFIKNQGPLTNQTMLQIFGTTDNITTNKRYANQRMMFEIFLFNDVIANKLKSYYKKVAPSAGTGKRLLNLKKIFSPRRAYYTAAMEKIQNLDKYYANDNRKLRDKNKSTNEVKQMSKKDIRQFVAEVLNENSGQGYGKYPYHSNEYTEEEPDQDYSVEWTSLVDEVCGSKRKNVDGDPNTVEDLAVEVAKILVKDSDLFRDVLEMAGANKSIGVEIMSQIKKSKEKKSLNKKMNV